jgi:hypothetical protein
MRLAGSEVQLLQAFQKSSVFTNESTKTASAAECKPQKKGKSYE